MVLFLALTKQITSRGQQHSDFLILILKNVARVQNKNFMKSPGLETSNQELEWALYWKKAVGNQFW